MGYMSEGGWNYDKASSICRAARQAAKDLMKSKQLAPSDTEVFVAKYIQKKLTDWQISIPRWVQEDACKNIDLSEGAAKILGIGSNNVAKAAKAAETGVANGASVAMKLTLTPMSAMSKTLRVGAPVAALAFTARGGWTYWQYRRGRINKREAGIRTAENAASAVGGLGASAAGAGIGTLICPGIGTAVGAVVGGIAGSIGSEFAVGKALR